MMGFTFTSFNQMIYKGLKEGAFHEGVTKGVLSLIPMKGDS